MTASQALQAFQEHVEAKAKGFAKWANGAWVVTLPDDTEKLWQMAGLFNSLGAIQAGHTLSADNGRGREAQTANLRAQIVKLLRAAGYTESESGDFEKSV